MLIVGGCGADRPTASPADVTTAATTAAVVTMSVPPTTASSTTATSGALTEPLAVRTVSEGLRQARVHWSEADIGSYRLTIAESLNYWAAGCTWITEVSEGVVSETEADLTECPPVPGTVEQLHEMISRWLDEVREFAGAEFGEHTLAVQFDDNGVPVALEFDLANGDDEESSMRVTFTPLA